MNELAPLKLDQAPLRKKIIESLRRAIETGVLQPGARLVEKDLCQQLGVSRTSLREALRELEADRVLESINRGLYVATLTRQDAENLYRIRGAIEALVAQQFIEQARTEDIKTLRRQSQELRTAYASRRLDIIVEARKRFYESLCKGANDPIAQEILSRITLRTSHLRGPSLARRERQEQSIHEIGDLIAAIEARDVAAAMSAARKHVENAAISALRITDGTQEVAAAPSQSRARSREKNPNALTLNRD